FFLCRLLQVRLAHARRDGRIRTYPSGLVAALRGGLFFAGLLVPIVFGVFGKGPFGGIAFGQVAGWLLDVRNWRNGRNGADRGDRGWHGGPGGIESGDHISPGTPAQGPSGAIQNTACNFQTQGW